MTLIDLPDEARIEEAMMTILFCFAFVIAMACNNACIDAREMNLRK